MSQFKNKNVVITGASRGIGLSISKRLAKEGANIAILAKTDVPHPKLPGTIFTAAKEIEEFGVKVLPIKTDIRFDDQVETALYDIKDKEPKYGMAVTGEVNKNMPQWVIEKAEIGLREQGKEMSGSKALILGMAYKKNVDDLRESPSLELIRLLQGKKAQVDYHDFYIPKLHKTRKYDYDLQSVSLDTISIYDLVILATDHDKYDYEFLQTNAQIIVDTRGRLNNTLNNVIPA